MSTKRPFRGSKRKSRAQGFRTRIKSKGGRKVLRRRILKGRRKLA